MINRISNTFYDGNSYYIPRSQEDAETGFVLASLASGAIMGTLPFFSKPFQKQMRKEHANNHLYKSIFEKSIKNSGLEKNGLKFEHTNFTKEDLAKLGTKLETQIVNKDIKAGMNACYVPKFKTVLLNGEKATISGFHELGHAMNHLQSKIGKFLQSLRKPGYAIAGLMGTLALFSRPKLKEAKRDLGDFALDNCGKIAFISLLPTVAEEALASYKGVKLAKANGLSDKLIKNLKKFYGKALISYFGYAVATGIAVFTASKITEYFTRPKKVTLDSNY